MLNKQGKCKLEWCLFAPKTRHHSTITEGYEVSIGRSPAATITVQNENVCLEHLQVWVDSQGRLLARDLSKGRTGFNFPLDRLPTNGDVFQLPSRGVFILAPDAGIDATYLVYSKC